MELVDTLSPAVGQRLARFLLGQGRQRGIRAAAGLQIERNPPTKNWPEQVGSIARSISTLMRLESDGFIIQAHGAAGQAAIDCDRR